MLMPVMEAQPAQKAKEMLTPSEAADVLGVAVSTLASWRQKNRLINGVHYTRYGKQMVRYYRTWIEKFRDSGGRGAHKLEVAEFLEAQHAAGSNA